LIAVITAEREENQSATNRIDPESHRRSMATGAYARGHPLARNSRSMATRRWECVRGRGHTRPAYFRVRDYSESRSRSARLKQLKVLGLLDHSE
jgi:hypothetical protein